MADEDEESEDEPAVELGDAASVEGAPLARVVSRLHFPLQSSEVIRREGEAVIRTPDGPQDVESILADVEDTYFASSDAFREAVQDVIGTGPVPTE